MTISKIAPQNDEISRVELEKAKTIMKMRFGSKFDTQINNQSLDDDWLMDDIKKMNKIKPDDYLSLQNDFKFQEEYVET